MTMDEEKYNHYMSIIGKSTYNRQDHWDIFDTLYYDKISNFNSMASFRTNGISNMLETGLPSQERKSALLGSHYDVDYSQQEKCELIKRFNELKAMLGQDVRKIKFNSEIGNPRNYLHLDNGDKYFLNFDDLYHVYSAWQIKRSIKHLLGDFSSYNILEIGAGYGNLAHKIKNIYKKSRYVIVDLPEVLLIQHYYLSKSNPSYKIVNLLDYDLKDESVGDIDCDFLLVPFGIYKDLNIKFDIAINTRSFGEMPKNILHDYFEWVQNNIKDRGLFYTTNRYVFTKSLDKNKIRDYPFDDFWNVVISQPQWLQTHLHEFMLQRSAMKPQVPLNFMLESFPISTPPPGPIMVEIQTQTEWLKHQKGNK